EGKFLGIHRFWWARPAKWRMEGLASWAACNLHPSPTSVNTTFWVQPHFVEHPETRLFARTYDALAWFQHIEGRAIGLWRRWPSVITAGADEQAYTQAVDGIEADVLDTLGASFAFQPHPPWSELWRMGGQCPG